MNIAVSDQPSAVRRQRWVIGGQPSTARWVSGRRLERMLAEHGRAGLAKGQDGNNEPQSE